jgi:uncharacterized protein
MLASSILKFAVFTMLFGLITSGGLQAAEDKKPHNLVIHVVDQDPARWKQTLSIAKNLKNDMGKENLDVEIVSHGPGLKMIYLESEVANLVAEAQKQGVAFAACNATMKHQKVSEKDLLDNVKVVPFGAKRIMERQEQGWTYLRM